MSRLIFCRHCGYEIERGDMGWIHIDGYFECPEGFGYARRAEPENLA